MPGVPNQGSMDPLGSMTISLGSTAEFKFKKMDNFYYFKHCAGIPK